MAGLSSCFIYAKNIVIFGTPVWMTQTGANRCLIDGWIMFSILKFRYSKACVVAGVEVVTGSRTGLHFKERYIIEIKVWCKADQPGG